MRNVVIIGSGCAGNTAAIYAARANLQPLVISGHEAGGQLSLTTLVENFPGFPEGINGPDLVENMKKQAEHFGAEYVHGNVVDADFSARPFRLDVEGEWTETRTVIVASGASARWLGLESEQKLIGHGSELVRHLRRVLLPQARRSWWWAAAIRPWKRPISSLASAAK
jgi:thioredoxin reductase (NADPH)